MSKIYQALRMGPPPKTHMLLLSELKRAFLLLFIFIYFFLLLVLASPADSHLRAPQWIDASFLSYTLPYFMECYRFLLERPELNP